jgi:CRP-like cAMP-binding protein
LRKVAELGPGEFFGEVALLRNQPRNATVRAATRVEVYTVDRATFDQYKSVSGPFINRILENFRDADRPG